MVYPCVLMSMVELKNKGERKRVVVRGNIISNETTFLNFMIVERPKGAKKKAEPKEEPVVEA